VTSAASRRTHPWRRSARTFLRYAIIYGLCLLVGTAVLLPFIWTLSSSLKPPGAAISFPPKFIPDPFQWDNYPTVFRMIPFLTFFKNSVIVTGIAVVGEVFTASLVAYAFARRRFPGRDVLFGIVLATMMVPYPVTMVPTFVMFSYLHFVNTFLPLILPAWFGPAFSIFLLRQFFRTINMDLDEAAKMDGAGDFVIYSRIIMPLAKPALATVAIFSAMAYWNDFLNPLIYLSDREKFTLAVGINFLRNFRSGSDTFPVQMAASVMFVVPCILLFFLAQRNIVQGIVTTGLKG
jgi:ABC-type glycerol-3-phosphate transport system permease component